MHLKKTQIQKLLLDSAPHRRVGDYSKLANIINSQEIRNETTKLVTTLNAAAKEEKLLGAERTQSTSWRDRVRPQPGKEASKEQQAIDASRNRVRELIEIHHSKIDAQSFVSRLEKNAKSRMGVYNYGAMNLKQEMETNLYRSYNYLMSNPEISFGAKEQFKKLAGAETTYISDKLNAAVPQFRGIDFSLRQRTLAKKFAKAKIKNPDRLAKRVIKDLQDAAEAVEINRIKYITGELMAVTRSEHSLSQDQRKELKDAAEKAVESEHESMKNGNHSNNNYITNYVEKVRSAGLSTSYSELSEENLPNAIKAGLARLMNGSQPQLSRF